jgi:hypothetical protein
VGSVLWSFIIASLLLPEADSASFLIKLNRGISGVLFSTSPEFDKDNLVVVAGIISFVVMLGFTVTELEVFPNKEETKIIIEAKKDVIVFIQKVYHLSLETCVFCNLVVLLLLFYWVIALTALKVAYEGAKTEHIAITM